jgi:hypothetical protein
MKLLTFDNAKSLLEKGEVYRIGYNALNEGEFLYEHKGFKRKDPSYAAHVQARQCSIFEWNCYLVR